MTNTEQKQGKKFIEVTEEFKSLVWSVGDACLKATGNSGLEAILQLYRIVDSAQAIPDYSENKED